MANRPLTFEKLSVRIVSPAEVRTTYRTSTRCVLEVTSRFSGEDTFCNLMSPAILEKAKRMIKAQ